MWGVPGGGGSVECGIEGLPLLSGLSHLSAV